MPQTTDQMIIDGMKENLDKINIATRALAKEGYEIEINDRGSEHAVLSTRYIRCPFYMLSIKKVVM
jgi:hypothetical protein